MAHFAEINADGIVQRVVVVANAELLDANGVESEQKGVAFLQSLYGPGTWVQTSYNATRRKNYAGVGFSYDSARDAFVPPKPFTSWVLDEATCRWIAPIPMPTDGKRYTWDEQAQSWAQLQDNPLNPIG